MNLWSHEVEWTAGRGERKVQIIVVNLFNIEDNLETYLLTRTERRKTRTVQLFCPAFLRQSEARPLLHLSFPANIIIETHLLQVGGRLWIGVVTVLTVVTVVTVVLVVVWCDVRNVVWGHRSAESNVRVTLQAPHQSWGSPRPTAAGQVRAGSSPVLSLLSLQSLQSQQDMLQGKAAILLHKSSSIL